MTPVLATENLTKIYLGEVPVTAVHDVTIAVHSGELVALTGPSGSGKTTLLGLLGLLDTPTAGEVRVLGQAAGGLSDSERTALRARMLGFVFQQFHLLGHLDALGNVEAALRYRGLRASQRRRLAMDALDRVGLLHRFDHQPARLSGGEQQRVAIARALVTRPALILADEPTGNLDTENSQRLLALMHELAHDGAAVVVVTHDEEVAVRSHRRIVMRDGSVVQPATVQA
ncbi:ABC transporter ATP-binding protein [Lentzea sp. NPDC051838]|uniref:ABC transporter ATP-binding protein n=1 Tax=Lentzea sp. NPDC051838 TaxID=3154849 RepID=UPI00341C8031